MYMTSSRFAFNTVCSNMLPLLKANKHSSQRESYRSVSLTPVLVKLMERMVKNRLLSMRKEVGPKPLWLKIRMIWPKMIIYLTQLLSDKFVELP